MRKVIPYLEILLLQLKWVIITMIIITSQEKTIWTGKLTWSQNVTLVPLPLGWPILMGALKPIKQQTLIGHITSIGLCYKGFILLLNFFLTRPIFTIQIILYVSWNHSILWWMQHCWSLTDMYWSCPSLGQFWTEVFHSLFKILNVSLPPNPLMALFGVDEVSLLAFKTGAIVLFLVCQEGSSNGSCPSHSENSGHMTSRLV